MEKASHPFVQWGQSEKYIFMTIKVGHADVKSIEIKDEEMSFSAFGLGAQGVTHYAFTIEYYLPINANESSYLVTDRCVTVKLHKELKDPWPRLTLSASRVPWIKFDFDRYQFACSDLEDDDDNEGPRVEKFYPTKEERERHIAEMKQLEDQEEWSEFIKLVKHPLTIYLLLYNIFQTAGMLYVFGILLYNILYHGEINKNMFYDQVIDRLALVQILLLLEPVHCLLGWVRGSLVASLLQVFGRNLVLLCIVIPHSDLHAESTLYWMFFAWSAIEIVRYPYYILSLLSFKNGLITYLRYTLWIPLYPLAFICEGKLILRVLPHLQQSRRFCLELPNVLNVSLDFPIFLQIYLLGTLGGFYHLMKQMYYQRRKVIGPRPIKGADQMGFFSFLPFLRSMVGYKTEDKPKLPLLSQRKLPRGPKVDKLQ